MSYYQIKEMNPSHYIMTFVLESYFSLSQVFPLSDIISMCLLVVYLYGEAAEDEKRKTVPQIRAGEYESLPEKVSINWSMTIL